MKYINKEKLKANRHSTITQPLFLLVSFLIVNLPTLYKKKRLTKVVLCYFLKCVLRLFLNFKKLLYVKQWT